MTNEIELMQGRFLSFRKDGNWEYVTRRNTSGAAHIVAVTDQTELVLVEQYRVPLHARTIELPAGVIGDGDAEESVELGAARELAEETGFEAENIEVLATTPTAPGLTSERFCFVQATGLKKVSDGGGVDGEDIRVHLVPIAALNEWLSERTREGIEIDSRIYAGLYLLKK